MSSWKRLAYVGVSRAREQLFLSVVCPHPSVVEATKAQGLQGMVDASILMPTRPSRFLRDLPVALVSCPKGFDLANLKWKASESGCSVVESASSVGLFPVPHHPGFQFGRASQVAELSLTCASFMHACSF